MPYTYDDQLVEAAGVRRRRLVSALLFRTDRLRRRWNPGVSSLVIGAFLAVLISAVCVAISFIGHLLSDDPVLRRPRAAAPTSVVTVIDTAPRMIATPPRMIDAPALIDRGPAAFGGGGSA